jgi:hypothetical protein
MPRRLSFVSRALALRSVLLAILGAIAALAAAPRGSRIHLAPIFTPGETLRYRIQTHTATSQHIVSPIVNPQGGSEFSQTISLLVRLDVLDAQPSAPVRFRATYEKSHSESQTDAFDPTTPSPDSQYDILEGRSVSFTLDSRGQFADFKGLEDIFPERSVADPLLSWLKVLSIGAAFPSAGVAIGEKWTSEQPLTGSPLTGLLWRAQSTYLRDEPCPASAASLAPASPQTPTGNTCAVILTRLEILRRASSSDVTPEDYRRNGLRTSGTWTGSGESLDSISLATGLLVSSTQSGTQNMDYVITSASSGSQIHRSARIESKSEITLLPASP